jgi:hypothetical protein
MSTSSSALFCWIILAMIVIFLVLTVISLVKFHNRDKHETSSFLPHSVASIHYGNVRTGSAKRQAAQTKKSQSHLRGAWR